MIRNNDGTASFRNAAWQMQKRTTPMSLCRSADGGFFGIGIEYPRTAANIGTLWRSAHIMHADFMFIIGERYQSVRTDTLKS